MKKIGYKDLQLGIEIELIEKIEKAINKIFPNFKNATTSYDNKEDKYFYDIVKYAVEIKNHYVVDSIEKRIESNLKLKKIDLKLFLYQNTTFNVSCFPRKIENDITQLQIFVSQHFFNNLNEDEQAGIIGHEIAHYLFDHLRFPSYDLINYSFDIGTIGELKSDLIYFKKISEITADIIGLVSNDFNYRAYSTALIKHTTGLNDSANSTFSITPLIDLVLKQYEEYATNVFFYDLHSTHPLMPVRVKIINTIINSKLVKHFGQEVSDKDYVVYKKEYDEEINRIIKVVYPEIFPYNDNINEILIPMSVAVMLADNKIDEKEILLIKNMIKKSHREFKELSIFSLDRKNSLSFKKIKEDLIKRSIEKATKKNFNKNLIIPILRALIIVAASDDDIEKSELKTIYSFAKEFNISKQDIILLIKTQYEI